VPGSYKDPGFGWMAGFMAAISFSGLLSLIPLRKVPMLTQFLSVFPIRLHRDLTNVWKSLL